MSVAPKPRKQIMTCQHCMSRRAVVRYTAPHLTLCPKCRKLDHYDRLITEALKKP